MMSPETKPMYPVQPVGPNEILATKVDAFPEEVFIAVNGLIAERLRGRYLRLTLKSLTSRMVELGLDGEEVNARGWNRIGAIYKKAGWEVKYHYPSGDDRDFDPYYAFETKDEAKSW